MRKIKNTRKCKGCFQSILKTKENIQENKYIQLVIDKNKEECIKNAIKKRTIERYYNISLTEEEKEKLKTYAKK